MRENNKKRNKVIKLTPKDLVDLFSPNYLKQAAAKTSFESSSNKQSFFNHKRSTLTYLKTTASSMQLKVEYSQLLSASENAIFSSELTNQEKQFNILAALFNSRSKDNYEALNLARECLNRTKTDVDNNVGKPIFDAALGKQEQKQLLALSNRITQIANYLPQIELDALNGELDKLPELDKFPNPLDKFIVAIVIARALSCRLTLLRQFDIDTWQSSESDINDILYNELMSALEMNELDFAQLAANSVIYSSDAIAASEEIFKLMASREQLQHIPTRPFLALTTYAIYYQTRVHVEQHQTPNGNLQPNFLFSIQPTQDFLLTEQNLGLQCSLTMGN